MRPIVVVVLTVMLCVGLSTATMGSAEAQAQVGDCAAVPYDERIASGCEPASGCDDLPYNERIAAGCEPDSGCADSTYNERIAAGCESDSGCDDLTYNERIATPCPSPTVIATNGAGTAKREPDPDPVTGDVAVAIAVAGFSAIGSVLWVAARRVGQDLI